MAKLVAKVYGDALFAEAVEKQKVDLLFEEAKTLRNVCLENEDLMQFLNHPKVVKEEKISVMENVFSGRICDDLMGFLTIIVDKGRQKEILRILDYFIAKVKEYKKIGVVCVTSAIELDDGQKARIREKLLKTTQFLELEIDYHVDSSLIGGLVIRIGDRVVDSSIRTKLEEMKRELMKLQLT